MFIRILLILIVVIVAVVLAITLFIKLAPQFGGQLTLEQKTQYEKIKHFEEGKFINHEEIDMKMTFPKIVKMIRAMSNAHPDVVPGKELGVVDFDESSRKDSSTETKLTWLGHSTFLLEMEGKNILVDPVFSERTSPVSFMGKKRFFSDVPIEIDELPDLDAILISHDHYDHLDYQSILKLKLKTNLFLVPLGVENHLKRWEVEEEKIHTFNWWEEFSLDSLKLAFVPSRHFSGRRLNDRYTTLWGGWVFQGDQSNIYYSGDGGYSSNFKEIGEKYGPFDLGLMECGQYNENWADVHMTPEESVQAAIDAKVDKILPVHWGAFTLAPHSWTDPIVRIVAEGEKRKIPVLTPMIGESILFGAIETPRKRWWERK